MTAALEPFERELFEDNRTSGRAEHPDAVAFDAMVRLCEHSVKTAIGPERTTGSRPLAMVIVHMSKAAYERGWTAPGETSEIEGVGPIPVAVARRMASDSIFKSLVTTGVDVTRVSHHGRTIPAHLRTAIEARDPVCTILGCETSRHLEIDHNIPVAAGGTPSSPTSADPAITTTTKKPATTYEDTDRRDNNASSRRRNTHG